MYLEHANINVRNLDECVRFLTTACPDFEIRHQGISDGVPWAHIGTAETYIALNESPESESTESESTGGPMNHLGFVVDDTDALAARMRGAGFREGFISPEHPHRKRRYFLDADGIEWEFVEYVSDDPDEYNSYADQEPPTASARRDCAPES